MINEEMSQTRDFLMCATLFYMFFVARASVHCVLSILK